MQKNLSDEDIIEISDIDTNVFRYPELTRYSNIHDIMKNGCCIILYEIENNFGHWTCLIERPESIEFFDSYGFFPDDELEYIPELFREVNNEYYPHLTALLYKATQEGKNVEYNDYRLQKMKDDINTCGRWCGVRLLMKELPIEDFVDIFKEDGDRKVTALTLDV